MPIYWLDDDARIIWPLVESLQDEGHEVKPVTTVVEALDQVGALKTAEALIVDMILPRGKADIGPDRYGGLSLLSVLRRQHGVHCPAVVLSVVSREELAPRMADMGVVTYLRKPATQQELTDAVTGVLQKAETQAAPV
jgi:CheY-like chemotaxis protein